MKTLTAALILLLTLAFFTACEVDDNKDDGTTIKTNVTKDMPGEELNDDEASELCVDIYTAVLNVEKKEDKIVEMLICDMAGVSAGGIAAAETKTNAEIEAACDKAVEECRENPPASNEIEIEETDPEDACGVMSDRLTTCEMEVGDIVDCFNAILAQKVKDAYDEEVPECSDLNAEYYEPATSDTTPVETGDTQPPECLLVAEKCARIMIMVEE